MAKACAYLCRQCCFIDGFREFGESVLLGHPTLVTGVNVLLLSSLPPDPSNRPACQAASCQKYIRGWVLKLMQKFHRDILPMLHKFYRSVKSNVMP